MSHQNREPDTIEDKGKETLIIKSVPNQEMKSNGKILIFMGAFVFGIALIPIIIFERHVDIILGVLAFLFCFFYFFFYFGGRYIFSYIMIYKNSIVLRHGFFFWSKKEYPLSDIIDVSITDSPFYQVYFTQSAKENPGSTTITIYFRSRPPYRKTSAYIANYKEIVDDLKEISKNKSINQDFKPIDLHIYGNHKRVIRCTKCGIKIYRDWTAYDECPNCRILALCKRAMVCFFFSSIPVILMVIVLLIGRIPILEIFTEYESMDWVYGYGYVAFLYIYISTATGFCTFMGLGSLVVTILNIKAFTSKNESGEMSELTSDEFAYLQPALNPKFIRKKIIIYYIIGLIFLAFKTLYVIQALIGNIDAILIILLIELVVDGLVYYLVTGISKYNSDLRGGVEAKFWSFINYGTLIIIILSIISTIAQLIMFYS